MKSCKFFIIAWLACALIPNLGKACVGPNGEVPPGRSIPAMRARPALIPRGLPGEGRAAVSSEPTLTILVQFSDQFGVTAQATWNTEIFAATSSVRDYYQEVSYYQPGVTGLDLPPANETSAPTNNGIAGWYSITWVDPFGSPTETRHPWNIYGVGWETLSGGVLMQEVAKAAVLAADPDVNFANFDSNGDSYISSRELHIILILAGYADFGGTQPRPSTWGFRHTDAVGITVDGVVVLRYGIPGSQDSGGFIIVGELDPVTLSNVKFGLLCHEMGHDLGLPDLYDTFSANGSSEGIGEWGLMGSGGWLDYALPYGDCPAHLCAWSKIQLGWISPTVVTTDVTGESIPRIEDNPVVYKLWTDGYPESEYFLICNRQNVGYDAGLVNVGGGTASGLLIWHIDEAYTDSAHIYNNDVNGDETHKGVDLECADAYLAGHVQEADDLDRGVGAGGNRGDNSDPWYSGNDWNFKTMGNSVPDSRDYNDTDTYVEVLNISSSKDTMTCDIQVTGPPRAVVTSPRANALNAPPNTDISAVFNYSMDPSTIDSSTFVVYGWDTGPHSGTISYNDPTRTATFDPDIDFLDGELVTAILTSGIKSMAGDSILARVWSFTIAITTPTNAEFDSSLSFHVGSVPDTSYPFRLYGAEFDNDGDIDLATANWMTDEVSVLLNDGNGAFSLDSNYLLPVSTPTFIWANDFDGDGWVDLATAHVGWVTVQILMNLGGGVFDTTSCLNVCVNPGSIFGSDFDGDGDIDLAVTCNTYNEIGIMFNYGGFSGMTTIWDLLPNPHSVRGGDLDNDGDVDLIVAGYTGTGEVATFLNDGTGSFSSPTSYSLVWSVNCVRCADFDGDEYLDLAVVNDNGSRLSIFLNDGDGTFPSFPNHYSLPPKSYNPFYYSDLDGDADIDLAIANQDSNSIYILLNDGSGGFGSYVGYSAGSGPSSVYGSDYDNDGDVDLAVTNYSSDSITILFNSGAGIAQFIRGDVDGSGVLTIGDGLRCFRCQFVPGWQDSCKCDDAVDADDNGAISIGDCLRILRKQFVPGWQDSIPPPCCSAPEDCGPDPNPDLLGCDEHPGCETRGKVISQQKIGFNQ